MKSRFGKTLAVLIAACVVSVGSAAWLGDSGNYAIYTAATAKKLLPIYRVDRADNKISVSFDCAWGTEYTDKILEILDEYEVKATFFAVEFWAEKYPDYCKKIVAAGHSVQTHSKTHPHMSKLSKDEIKAELASSKAAIEKITGEKVTLFRPPFGDYNDKVIAAAEEEGLYSVQWDVDSLDWKNLSAKEIAARVISRAKSGSIILMHNNGLHTAESLPLVFAPLKAQGYESVGIEDLIYKDGYEILRDGTQREIKS